MDDDDDGFMADIIERVQRASRAFRLLDEVDLIMFDAHIEIMTDEGKEDRS